MTTDNTDAMPTAAPRVTDFAYPAFYRAMVERERMQVSREEAVWSESGASPEEPVDVLLNFGCGVRQTPHLQREAVAVLEALGVEFAAVAGQKYCCGKPYSSNGLKDAAKEIVSGSVQRMERFQPKRAIQWCSACEMQFKDLVQPDVGIEFSSDGIAEFLVERIDELGDGIPWRTDVHVRAVVHGHLGEHPVRDGHPPIVMSLLQRIPGVELIGLAESDALDLCDNVGARIATYGTEEYAAAQAALKGYLSGAGADTLVTMYHACTRELTKFADDELRIRHYISILAEALGVSKPDRFSQYWRMSDPAAIVEASRPNWESWGITEQEALLLAHKYFVPSYAARAPECPCNGTCSRTGSDWLLPHGV
ncbi:MAG: heterodisulfide reductase-related iron-sulfur binding cluster [Kribbellaceae bacterium]